MLDRMGNEIDFTELFMEETLSAKDKKDLPDSMYGLVYTDDKGNKVRKFPLNDEAHVRQAAIFFDRAKGLSDDQKRELARNIVKRAKELDMDYSGWDALKPYLEKNIQETYIQEGLFNKSNFNKTYTERIKPKIEEIDKILKDPAFPDDFRSRDDDIRTLNVVDLFKSKHHKVVKLLNDVCKNVNTLSDNTRMKLRSLSEYLRVFGSLVKCMRDPGLTMDDIINDCKKTGFGEKGYDWKYLKYSLIDRYIPDVLNIKIYVNESFDDMFGDITSYSYYDETYKPYDEYLKLHQYDPKTNTIVINGKRYNAGMKGSNKERNRMNKFLRENNYNPKDGTIETRIKNADGSKQRVRFDINSHDSSRVYKSDYSDDPRTLGNSMDKYEIRKNGKTIGRDFQVGMTPRTMSQKPGLSNQTYQHEITHGDIFEHPEKYSDDLKEVNQQNKDEYNRGDYDGGNPAQVAHAVDNEEKLADYYGAINNPYGTSWHKTDMNKARSEENNIKNRNTKSIKQGSDKIMRDLEFERDYSKSNLNLSNYEKNIKEDVDRIKKKAADGRTLRPYEKEMLNFTDDDIKNEAKDRMSQEQKEIDDDINARKAFQKSRLDKNLKMVEKTNKSFDNEMNNRQNYVQNRLNQQNKTNDQQQNNQTNTNNGYNKNGFEHQPSPNESNNNNNNVSQESFNDMFGEVIQEASNVSNKNKLIPIKKPDYDEMYFASPTNHMPEIDLKGPLFVTPFKGIASIFVGRDAVRDHIPKGSYNLGYKEFSYPNNKLKEPLKEVHVYVEGYPFLEPFSFEDEGYIHCIKTKDYADNFYRYEWMAGRDSEFLIANTDNIKVEFTRVIKCKVRYIVEGKPGKPGSGPDPHGLLIWAKQIVDKIHNKHELDKKEPAGNQNCQLCAWCAEAQFRGNDVLPRPIYSPRDFAFDIEGETIVKGSKRKKLKSFSDLMNILLDADTTFGRWYCHVKWSEGNGGHEFIILVLSDKVFIMDPQQGKVSRLTANHSYIKDIDWNESFVCRMDNKKFNYTLFEKTNDPSKTLQWDPKKDIPYMLKHGMCSKEDAEVYVKESASNPTPTIPKDLRDWLKKGDYSSLEKDDSFYYIEGHPVEEFFEEPEFCKGYFYPDNEEDPILHCVVFSDENGNGLVYDWIDECYYYAYHDWIDDDTGFLHRERLSSKSWTQIINPDHSKSIKDLDEKRSEISKELTRLKANPIYDDIEYGATNSHFGKGFFKSDCSAMEKRWNAIGHEWCNAVKKFADKYKFSELSETVNVFANKTMPSFVPTIGSHEYDISAYKEGAKGVIKAFQDVEKSLKETSIQEGAWQDIKNGVNPYSMKRVFHITKEGHLDGQIFKPRVPEYLDKYDPTKPNFEDVDSPRVCFSPSIEGCLNAILVNIGRWKTADRLGDWYVYIPEKPLKDYKHKTTRELIKDKKVYDANVTNEIWIEEPVRLKQYGIIHVDQVSDVSKKKTVPMLNGKSGERNKYNFKWHWLVKPKVLKNVPYEYTPESVCEDMVMDMKRYNYGFVKNGKISKGSSEDYDKYYRLESPEEFEENGGGICYDYVEFQEGYLDAYGFKCKKYFIYTETEDNDTHTFMLVEDGNGKLIYPESSFKLLEGCHVVKDVQEAIRKITEQMFNINNNAKKYDEIPYYVWEYEGHPPYGSDMKTCHEYFTKGEPLYEGIAKK